MARFETRPGAPQFDTRFSGRAHVAQVVATESYDLNALKKNHSHALMAHGGGVGLKAIGALVAILGAAMLVGGDPFGGLVLISKGVGGMLGGNAMKAAALTYGETIDKGAAGHEESGTKIVERFRDNYKTGVWKPW